MRDEFTTKLDFSQMTDENGQLVGYIPYDIDIWIPPKPEEIESFRVQLDNVILQGKGKFASIVFFVPKDWVVTGKKRGWKTRLKDIGWSKNENTSKLLDQFIRLAEAKPERYLMFAKEWGPLWKQADQSINNEEISLLDYNVAPLIESVEVWRLHSRIVKSVLEIASYINQDPPKLAPVENWKSLLLRDKNYQKYLNESTKTFPPFDESRYNTIEKQRREITLFINYELLKHWMKFYIDWQGEEPELKIGSRLGFLSAVWFQLLQTVTKQNICLCDGCGKVYVRIGRKPQRNRNNYCEECGEKAAKKAYEDRKPGRKTKKD